MMSRLDPVIAWWEGRTRRERILLGIMAGLLAAVIAWYGVIAPIGAWRADAADRRAEASAALQSVEAERCEM